MLGFGTWRARSAAWPPTGAPAAWRRWLASGAAGLDGGQPAADSAVADVPGAVMSLTGALRDRHLGHWCAATLTGTGRLVDDVTAAATGHRPVRPGRVDDPEHWPSIGGALGARLAGGPARW